MQTHFLSLAQFSYLHYLCVCVCVCVSSMFLIFFLIGGSPVSSDGKEFAYNVGDLGSVSGAGRSPGEGHGYPLQYSCLENPHG